VSARPDLHRVLNAYQESSSEARTEALLAAELAAFGWNVVTQPWCWSPRHEWRRPDIWAILGRDVLCIELKHDTHFHSKPLVTAWEQSCRYREASVWCMDDGTPIVTPSQFMVSSTFLLRKDGRNAGPPVVRSAQQQVGAAVRQYEQMIWRSGVSMLYRERFDLRYMRYESGPPKIEGRPPALAQRTSRVVEYPTGYPKTSS
jgi:hypothetical protein